MKNIRLTILILIFLTACKPSIKIIDKPIVFDETRKQLTLDYLYSRYGLEQEKPVIAPKMIVLHWTAIPTFEKSFEAFEQSTLPSWRPDIKDVSGLNVSAHFLIDQDGTIYRLMPETLMARHVIGLNHTALGIENVGGTENKPLTEAQLKSNIRLVEHLTEKYPIEYLLGHYEYVNFEDHPLWLEKDDGYRTKKTDPGIEFMQKVRQATKNLNFTPVPNKPKTQ